MSSLSFRDVAPEHNQIIAVILGQPGNRHCVVGVYRFSGDHQHPHHLYAMSGDNPVLIHKCTDDAHFIPVHALVMGFLKGMDESVSQQWQQAADDASL